MRWSIGILPHFQLTMKPSLNPSNPVSCSLEQWFTWNSTTQNPETSKRIQSVSQNFGDLTFDEWWKPLKTSGSQSVVCPDGPTFDKNPMISIKLQCHTLRKVNGLVGKHRSGHHTSFFVSTGARALREFLWSNFGTWHSWSFPQTSTQIEQLKTWKWHRTFPKRII